MSDVDVFLGIGDQAVAHRYIEAFAREGLKAQNIADGVKLWDCITRGRPRALLTQWNLSRVSGLELLFKIRCRPRLKRLPVGILVPGPVLPAYLEKLDPKPNWFILPEDEVGDTSRRIASFLDGLTVARAEESVLHLQDISLDPNTKRVFWRKRQLELASDEFRLLHLLMKRAGEVLSREEIIASVWDGRKVVHRTVDVIVGRVRNSLKKPSGKAFICTVRGVGYVFPVMDAQMASDLRN